MIPVLSYPKINNERNRMELDWLYRDYRFWKEYMGSSECFQRIDIEN